MEEDGSFTDVGEKVCSYLSVCRSGIQVEVCVAVTPTQSQALQLTAVQWSVPFLKLRTWLLSWPRRHSCSWFNHLTFFCMSTYCRYMSVYTSISCMWFQIWKLEMFVIHHSFPVWFGLPPVWAACHLLTVKDTQIIIIQHIRNMGQQLSAVIYSVHPSIHHPSPLCL